MPDDVRLYHAVCVQRVEGCTDVSQVVDVAVSTWCSLHSVLSPVIGQRGFFELYRRSLFVLRVRYPWLLVVYEDTKNPDEFVSLRRLLLQQGLVDATQSNGALVQTFYDLLGKLIGEPLSERLLGFLLEKPSSGNPAQDTSP